MVQNYFKDDETNQKLQEKAFQIQKSFKEYESRLIKRKEEFCKLKSDKQVDLIEKKLKQIKYIRECFMPINISRDGGFFEFFFDPSNKKTSVTRMSAQLKN
jgi:hypothetical protein